MQTQTITINTRKYNDLLIDDLMTWVRDVPLDSDAIANIPFIITAYEKRKTTWQRAKELLKNL